MVPPRGGATPPGSARLAERWLSSYTSVIVRGLTAGQNAMQHKRDLALSGGTSRNQLRPALIAPARVTFIAMVRLVAGPFAIGVWLSALGTGRLSDYPPNGSFPT